MAAEPPHSSRAKPARDFASGEAASEIPGRRKFNSTLHQSSHGFATRVHGFATKTKALAREIPPATQATGIMTAGDLLSNIDTYRI